jgi:vacuolar-type H+-ATPase subunit H
MGASRIEQLIEDIYEFVESCRMQPLSSTKVIVPKDELYDLLGLRTPDEIKRYQKIIVNRDAIIADAEEKAAAILAEAGEKAHSLLDEHEIMQQAYYQANELVGNASQEADKIINDANMDANQIRQGALNYTNEMLTDVEHIIVNAYESSRSNYEGLLNALKGNLDIVVNNKKELHPEPVQAAHNPEPAGQEEEFSQDDFNFDENTFLEDID